MDRTIWFNFPYFINQTGRILVQRAGPILFIINPLRQIISLLQLPNSRQRNATTFRNGPAVFFKLVRHTHTSITPLSSVFFLSAFARTFAGLSLLQVNFSASHWLNSEQSAYMSHLNALNGFGGVGAGVATNGFDKFSIPMPPGFQAAAAAAAAAANKQKAECIN